MVESERAGNADALISVIVPCYNYAGFIAQTLQSVQRQSDAHWECIVIDDGSTDASAEAVRPFLNDARFRYVHQHNQGLSAARNTGLREAKGGLIQFLDADDLLSEDKFERHRQFLRQFPQVEIGYSDFRYFPSDSPQELFPSLELDPAQRLPKVAARGGELLRALVGANIMPVNAPLINRSAIDRAGLFDTALRSLEDWDLWLRCAMTQAEIRYMGDGIGLALIRVHGVSMSKNRATMLRSELALRKKIDGYLTSPAVAPGERKALRAMNQRYTIRTLGALLCTGSSGQLRWGDLLRDHGFTVFIKASIRAWKKGR